MVSSFLQQCSKQLKILNICYFVNNGVLAQIGECKGLTELYLTDLFDSCSINFNHLLQLNNLVTLNLSNTGIEGAVLINILKVNPRLQHLSISNTSILKYRE